MPGRFFFLSDQPSDLSVLLLRIGEYFSAQGHDIVIVDDPRNVGCRIEGLSGEAVGGSRLRMLLLQEIHQMDRRILAKLLDELHLTARAGLPVGCIATGHPETLKLVGELRSFSERLIEFRHISVP